MFDISTTILEKLWAGVWQGTLLFLLVLILTRVFKDLSPKWKYWLWWCVSLKFLLVLLPQWSIALPVTATVPQPIADGVNVVTAPTFLPSSGIDSAATVSPSQPLLPTIIAAVWLLGMIVGVAFFATEWIRLKILLRHSVELKGQPVAALTRTLALKMGLTRLPRIYESAAVSSPFVTGMLGTRLVLPQGIENRLSPDELDAALAHELAHFKRRDLLLGIVPSLARLLFFFLPPAHIASREWAIEREAACDAEAIELTSTPAARYGDLLVKIVSHDHAPAMSPCLGATASFYTLKRRIMLMKSFGVKQSRWLRLAAPALLLLTSITLVSWRCTQAGGDNLWKNSSVESDSVDWNQGTAVRGVTYSHSSGVSHSGRGSLLITKSIDKYFPIASWNQTFPYTGSKKGLKVSAFVRARSVKKAVIDVMFQDENHQMLSHEWVAFIGIREDGDVPANDDWKEYSNVVAIPDATKFITVSLQDYGAGSVWFDDISATYTDPPAPPTSLVRNGGFEEGFANWTEDAFPPNAVGRTGVSVAQMVGHNGKAIMFTRTENRYLPVELYTQNLPAPNGKSTIDISAWVKAHDVGKATIQIMFDRGNANETRQWGIYVGAYNEGDPPANHDWKKYSGSFPIPPGTQSITIALEMYGPGTVYFDDIQAAYK